MLAGPQVLSSECRSHDGRHCFDTVKDGCRRLRRSVRSSMLDRLREVIPAHSWPCIEDPRPMTTARDSSASTNSTGRGEKHEAPTSIRDGRELRVELSRRRPQWKAGT